MSVEKRCTNCFHLKRNWCRLHGYYWSDEVAKKTNCASWKELMKNA